MSQLSTFHVGKYLFGVDVSLVQEVVRLQMITPVPLASPEIAGLINLRGEVLTAFEAGYDAAIKSFEPYAEVPK